MKTIRLCPGCGTPLTSDALGGLCPQCLLKTQVATDVEGLDPVTARLVPVPGGQFGDYRILKLLGHGGMGEVYEAEHITTGRRVALKVMRHSLASEDDRKRFLREGRLAASVNHPNVVYIHGSEEIEGAPAIAMELVHGGTLKDRLKREGPLAVPDAVEAALQILDGLEAAHAAGVLHRDIKPANCFVAADGAVKVGDFGLSVSTLARGESLITASGAVMGTPAYASPEQLRGEDLDVRSDIYSVGATLYHLLTGRTPFEATDFVKLITEVLDKQPTPAKSLRPEIPAELSKILTRCLAKERKARFQTYADLRDALLPFRAAESVPGRAGIRFLADLLDGFIAYAPSLMFLIYWSFDPIEQFSRDRTWSAGLMAAALYAIQFIYYSVAEGLWGAGLGKMICGLRVIGPDRQPPGVLRALLRTTIYLTPSMLPALLTMVFVSAQEHQAARGNDDWLLTDWLWIVLHACLFVTMRRRNGYAAVHDLLSRTRVIVRPKAQLRPGLSEREASPVAGEISDVMSFGPYEVQATLWQRDGEELLLGFDPALRRRVWIHRQPSNSSLVSSARHDLSRPARLRWLSNGQSETHVWDVYEAVEGSPLLKVAATAQSWNAVRFWLHDLATEAAALLQEGDSTPLLALNRIWISTQGRALLLEFPCPEISLAVEQPRVASDEMVVQEFLHSVASVALKDGMSASWSPQGPRTPLPLPGQTFLQSLARGGFSEARMIVGNLESLLGKSAEVTRSRRAASIALMPIVFLGLGLIAAGMFAFERYRREKAWSTAFPGEPSLALMDLVHDIAVDTFEEGVGTSNDVRNVEAYFIKHYGHLITNDLVWKNPRLKATLEDVNESKLRRMIRNSSPANGELSQEAERSVRVRLRIQERAGRSEPIWVLFGVVVCGFIVFALLDLVGCLVARVSPVLRFFGIAVVNAQGQPVTRRRLLVRMIVVWPVMGVAVTVLSIFGAIIIASLTGSFMGDSSESVTGGLTVVAWMAVGATALLLAALIGYAIRHPARGLQDRVAGTALVPR